MTGREDRGPAGDPGDGTDASIGPEHEAETTPGTGGADGWADDERVQAGIEHLQRAANEAIAAGRALLDVAEDLVGDPRSLTEVLGLLGRIRPGSVASPRRHEGGGEPPAEDDPPVQRIPVS